MRRRSFSEKWLEDRLASAFSQAGFQNFHMSAPALPGIPDRYVMGKGGLWIEIKQGKTFIEMSRDFDRQRRFLTALARGGDKPFICALWQPRADYNDPRLFIESWHIWQQRERGKRGEFENIKGSPYRIEHPDDVSTHIINFATALL